MAGSLRVMVESIKPSVDGGRFAIKRLEGETVKVTCDAFADGHDVVVAALLYKGAKDKEWNEVRMQALGNDHWEAAFTVSQLGFYLYTVEAWIDHFITWQNGFRKKMEVGQAPDLELLIGATLIDEAVSRAKPAEARRLAQIAKLMREGPLLQDKLGAGLSDELTRLMARNPDRSEASKHLPELRARVEPVKAGFSTWYELFPRSWSNEAGKHGTFKDVEKKLPAIRNMGFDVLYFPPIHPIGEEKRKGKNNSLIAGPFDPGSPWAIGSKLGGHTAIHPQLGNLKDFKQLVKKARDLDMEIALDFAIQCAPDHPWVKEHPEWFNWRPDGTVQYAENPPKRYEDVLPINFETKHWKSLWEELKSIVDHWITQGVRIFRVDNPHTKAFPFWEWLIEEIHKKNPDIIFLAEAFTRPRLMYRLGKIGFTQSYSYFTWRNTKTEFIEYINELTQTEVKEFYRPNFWPNTPDILMPGLQHGGRPAFIMRYVLAATLSGNCGIYGPAFELLWNKAHPGKEEYTNNEKYEIRSWNWDAPGNLKDFLTLMNGIRNDHSSLQSMDEIGFYYIDNDQLLAYLRRSPDGKDALLVIVNLDPYNAQSGWVQVPCQELGLNETGYEAHDLLSGSRYTWQGTVNFVQINPHVLPAHIFSFRNF